MSIIPYRKDRPIYIKKGSTFSCDDCNSKMYRTERDLYSGAQMVAGMFFNLQSNEPGREGEIIMCLNCGVIPLSKFGLAENWRLE